MNLKFKEAKDDHKTVSVDLEESGDVVFVNKYVQKLGIIVLIKFLECLL
jgi:hypothetical protein